MRTTYLQIAPLGEVYAEYPSVLRGRRWFDFEISDGELLLYLGRLHVVATPEPKRTLRVVAGLSVLAIALGTDPQWLSSLLDPVWIAGLFGNFFTAHQSALG